MLGLFQHALECVLGENKPVRLALLKDMIAINVKIRRGSKGRHYRLNGKAKRKKQKPCIVFFGLEILPALPRGLNCRCDHDHSFLARLKTRAGGKRKRIRLSLSRCTLR